jgi:hypothetical protein
MVLAVVIATGLVTMLLTQPHETEGGKATLRVADSLPSDSPSDEPSDSPSTRPSASVRPTPSETPTDTQTTPASDGSGSSGGGSGGSSQVMGDLGPVPPGSAVFGYTPGRHSWSATSNGIAIAVQMSPAAPRAGETVTFDVHSSAAARCCYAYMVFGNGRGTPDVHCMEGPTGTDYHVQYTTIYNRPGRYEFLAGAMRGKSCDDQGDLYAYIEIAPGTSSGQGPDLPAVKVDSSTPKSGHEGDPAWLTLWGDATDDDGYLTKLVIDWGDGTTDTLPGDDGSCQVAADGWPAGTEAMLPGEPHPPYHHYLSYGRFHVTLTAVSTACNGSDVQRGHASMSWDNPAPPKPSPSPTA